VLVCVPCVTSMSLDGEVQEDACFGVAAGSVGSQQSSPNKGQVACQIQEECCGQYEVVRQSAGQLTKLHL